MDTNLSVESRSGNGCRLGMGVEPGPISGQSIRADEVPYAVPMETAAGQSFINWSSQRLTRSELQAVTASTRQRAIAEAMPAWPEVQQLGRRTAAPVQGMQKWEGHVTEVDLENGLFSAELTPTHDGPVLVADFDVGLVSEADRDLLSPGSVFYLTVRTVLGRGRQPFRTSTLRMRRLGMWTEEAVEAINRRAQERASGLAEIAD